MVQPFYMKKKKLCLTADPQISKRFRSHSRALIVRFFVLRLWRHGVEWDYDAIADVGNGWGECIVPIWSDVYACNVRFLFCPVFLLSLHSMF